MTDKYDKDGNEMQSAPSEGEKKCDCDEAPEQQEYNGHTRYCKAGFAPKPDTEKKCMCPRCRFQWCDVHEKLYEFAQLPAEADTSNSPTPPSSEKKCCKKCKNLDHVVKTDGGKMFIWKCSDVRCKCHTSLSSDGGGWEQIAAKTALAAYKEKRHYAKFSEIIYASIRSLVARTEAAAREDESDKCNQHIEIALERERARIKKIMRNEAIEMPTGYEEWASHLIALFEPPKEI